jgi:cell wall-associated NlpC family hydrolase
VRFWQPDEEPVECTQRDVIVSCVLEQIGKPQSTLGAGPDSFDASGLTKYCFARAGIALPHESYNQSLDGTDVDCTEAEAGDLIFYYDPPEFVGTFTTNKNVVQVSEGQNVKLYENIFGQGFWNPIISQCKRYWSCNATFEAILPTPTPAATRSVPPVLSDQQEAILSCLANQIGRPYGEGQPGPGSFDAVGLTTYCFRRAGIELPPDIVGQSESELGTLLRCIYAEPGDLIFYFDPAALVGVFQTSQNVIQVDNGEAGVEIVSDILNHGYYGQEIAFCKRYWSVLGEVPNITWLDPTASPNDPTGVFTLPNFRGRQPSIIYSFFMMMTLLGPGF